MWIRNQNRAILVNVQSVFRSCQTIYAKDNVGLDILLGMYDSEERAMEILDQMQFRLMDTAIENENQFIIVFEMPEK